MKRLFDVRDNTTRKIVSEHGFDNKQAAKAYRDQLNGEDDKKRFVVVLGPDHHRYHD